MKKNLTLLIMAAGMGSRYGGLKQIEPIGPNGEFLIDYSIYDAVKAGFNKVVFVIKKENEQIFKETVGNRVAKSVAVEYAFQNIEDLPLGYTVPEGRTKPWGTCHAIMSAKNYINEPFAIINADDFYGRDAYETIASFLLEENASNIYAVVGYYIKNTLSENGSVKRGICFEQNGKLTHLIESLVIKENGTITASPLNGSEPFTIEEETLVSMNMLGFQSSLFPYLEKNFPLFLDKNKDNNMNCEYLIPDAMYEALQQGTIEVSLLSTSAVWQGITHREDKEKVVLAIQSFIKDGEYPEKLWN